MKLINICATLAAVLLFTCVTGARYPATAGSALTSEEQGVENANGLLRRTLKQGSGGSGTAGSSYGSSSSSGGASMGSGTGSGSSSGGSSTSPSSTSPSSSPSSSPSGSGSPSQGGSSSGNSGSGSGSGTASDNQGTTGTAASSVQSGSAPNASGP